MDLNPIPPQGSRRIYVAGEGMRYRPGRFWTLAEQGQRLRARRQELRVGLREATKRAGLRLVEWSAIEAGRAPVSAEDEARLMAALDAR